MEATTTTSATAATSRKAMYLLELWTGTREAVVERHVCFNRLLLYGIGNRNVLVCCMDIARVAWT